MKKREQTVQVQLKTKYKNNNNSTFLLPEQKIFLPENGIVYLDGVCSPHAHRLLEFYGNQLKYVNLNGK